MNRTSSLADFLEQYRRQHPEDVFLVDDEVDVEYQPTAYYKLLEEEAAGALNEEPDYAAR